MNKGRRHFKALKRQQASQAAQLSQLEANYLDLMAKYIGLIKSNGETVGRAMLADNKLHNFMVIAEGDKADWIKERDGLKKDIAELKIQVQELLALVKERDKEIVDLKNEKD